MTGNARWPRVWHRGAVVAIVAASHVALFVWIVQPPRPRARGHRMHQSTPAHAVLQVTLIEPPSSAAVPVAHERTTSTAHVIHRSPLHLATPPSTARAAPPQDSAAAATSDMTTSTAPAFIAGGGFAGRLRAAQAAPPMTKLPGGHRYTASRFEFVPVQQQSIEAKVHKVAGYLFGGFDPTCKNAQLELTKSRLQQIADGYTPEDLERLVREHCR